jgi:hypothetical protein
VQLLAVTRQVGVERHLGFIVRDDVGDGITHLPTEILDDVILWQRSNSTPPLR